MNSTVTVNELTTINGSTVDGGLPLSVTIFYTCGECAIAIGAILGNALVLYAIAKYHYLQTFTNYFIASLAVADLLVGAVGIPCSLVAFYGLPQGFWGCLFMNTMIIILTQISIFGLVTISLERYTAIQYPFFYEKHCNGNSAASIISATWILAITVGFVPVFGWNMHNTYNGLYCTFTGVVNMYYMVFFNFFGFVLSPLLIMFSVYCYIFKIVRQQLRRIASVEISSAAQSVARSSVSENHPDCHRGSLASTKHNLKKTKETIVRELRAAKWFAFVIFLFAICWMPLHIMNTISLLSEPVSVPWVITAILLSHLNSAVNPVLYAYSNTKFKAAMMGVIGCKPNRLQISGSRSFIQPSNSVAQPPSTIYRGAETTTWATARNNVLGHTSKQVDCANPVLESYNEQTCNETSTSRKLSLF